MKRASPIIDVVFVSDLHCGSVYGLTPPEEFKASHHREIQEESWEAYLQMTREWSTPDILIGVGDMIEGKQSKQGGAELITPDRTVQAGMAVTALKEWRAKKIYLVFGSKYHVGDEAEDFEFSIARELGATIEGRLYLNIAGMVFDIRHKIGTSAIPHGRGTPLLREIMWDLIREANGTGPKVDVVVRAHAHYHLWIEQPDKIAFITPPLQISRGRFGSRECTGETHWGAIRLGIQDGKIVRKDVKIWKLKANRARVYRA